MSSVPMVLRRAVGQSLLILVISLVAGLGLNALRPDGLPLLHAESVVKLDAGQEISLQDATVLHVSKRGVFLDARSAGEYQAGHIQGALHLPPTEYATRLAALRPKLEGKTALIAYCDGEKCDLSRDLAQQLALDGFTNVKVLKNGWTLWQQEGLPTAKGAE